jgi:hypothetical protein
MQTFCDDIVADIKAANNEGEVIKVISYTMSRIRLDRNNEFSYIMNIITSLRSIDPTAISGEAQLNVKLAIAIFTQFHQGNLQRIP